MSPMTIVGFDGVTLDPPATSIQEAQTRTKDNPRAQRYRHAMNTIISARINTFLQEHPSRLHAQKDPAMKHDPALFNHLQQLEQGSRKKKPRKVRSEDGPEKVDFEYRQLGQNRYEAIPRRRSDKKLFDVLTVKQQTAFNRIEEARGYEMTGLPHARMKYSDAPGGFDYELTPSQMDAIADYRQWRTEMYTEYQPCHYAVISYMNGRQLKDIEAGLRIHRGKAIRYISIALNRYCIMKGWGDQERGLNLRPVKITGFADELTNFTSFEYVDGLGNPVALFGQNKRPENV